jgi:putative ABC transport system permease protein
MQIKPILAALKRHKAGTLLIALQIALTLAIVCNALFIIHQRVTHLSRPTGIDEANIVTVMNQWVGKPPAEQVGAMMAADLDALRHVPGVVDAYATNSYPLRMGGWSMGLSYKPNQDHSSAHTAIYFADGHTLATLGLKLIAGRNFRADEIGHMDVRDKLAPPTIIVTRELAQKLYPDGSALGKTVYITDKPTTIVGIVERLEVPWVDSWAAQWAEYSTLVPERLTMSVGGFYVVRVKPGQMDAAVKAIPKALFAQNRMRVIDEKDGVQRFSEVRAKAYARDRGMAILMGVVCAVLLAITAAGIVGLTSFWVGQRRKQIGVRRALGATRRDILSYFLTENLLIGSAGVVIGALLAVGMNLWLVSHFAMERLSLAYVAAGIVALLALGQGAVLAPAMRASRVPPVEATRSV